MAMQPIGSVSIRPPETTELACLDASLHGKVAVAEWKPGLDPEHTPPVKLLVFSTDRGRRFYLTGHLNGWSSPKEAVRAICLLGLRVAETNKVIPQEQLDRALFMLLLNVDLMPFMSEFRKRSYAWGRDFTVAAKDQIGLMLAFQLSEEPKPGGKVSLARDPRLNAAAEDVFPTAESVKLFSRFALYAAKCWRKRDQLTSERIRQAVITSVLAGDLKQDEVSCASETKTAEALIARVIKIAGREKDELLSTLLKLKGRGFNDIAKSLKIPREEVRRGILSLTAGTFWDLAVPWTVVMVSIRGLVQPLLSAEETTVFDRLYLPQAHLAGLPPYLLWPRYDLVIPVSQMLLDTPEDESWRFNAIPWSLEAFAETDDITRRSDRARKGKGGRERLAPLAKGGSKKAQADWLEIQATCSGDSTPIDRAVLKRDFAQLVKSGSVPCPSCGEQVRDLNVCGGDSHRTVALELFPCGCIVSASDFR